MVKAQQPAQKTPANDREHVQTEAALWVVRTRDDSQAQPALDAWLAQDDANAAAYADSVRVWQEIGQIAPDWKAERPPLVTRRRVFEMAMAACAVFATAGVYGFFLHQPVYKTDVGVTRVVSLSDGSRITLNTDTVVKVHYTPGRRQIRLLRGEALFDVAHNTQRPFVVEAGGEYIHALGTSFSVRHDKGRVDVTLLSGSVRVDDGRQDSPDAVVLAPGERLRKGAAGVQLDHPQLDAVTAWRDGELILDNTPLREAVAEMNRYNTHPIVLQSQTAGAAKLSGVYRTGESRDFSRTVAAIYGLHASETANAFVVSGEVAPAR